MPWVRFLADYDFKPRPSVTLAYRAGDTRLVTTACARAAVAKGKAERVLRKPSIVAPADNTHG